MRTYSIFLFTIIFGININGQSLRGSITDSETGESIPSADIIIKNEDTIIDILTSDFDGKFQFQSIKPGIYSLEVNFIGYLTSMEKEINIKNKKTTTINVKLKEDSNSSFESEGCYFDIYTKFSKFSSGKIFYLHHIHSKPINR